MDEDPHQTRLGRSRSRRESFLHQIGKKEARKIRARRSGKHSLWFGLGMFGTVGWSVAIPTVLGVALGLWLDRTWPAPFSWTLTGLAVGVMLGCLNAWYWIQREGRS